MGVNLWTNPNQQLFPGASVAQNNFTSAKDLPIGENSDLPLIYGRTLQAGSRITIDASGIASNTATPTLILGVYWGGVAGTALAVSTAKTTTTAMTNWQWDLHLIVRVLTVGPLSTSSSMMPINGYWRLPTSLTAWTEIRLPETAPASVTSLDTSVNKVISVGATWSAASASNTITCHDMRVTIDG